MMFYFLFSGYLIVRVPHVTTRASCHSAKRSVANVNNIAIFQAEGPGCIETTYILTVQNVAMMPLTETVVLMNLQPVVCNKNEP